MLYRLTFVATSDGFLKVSAYPKNTSVLTATHFSAHFYLNLAPSLPKEKVSLTRLDAHTMSGAVRLLIAGHTKLKIYPNCAELNFFLGKSPVR